VQRLRIGAVLLVRLMERIGAIILAAGGSSRLGRLKQLLEFRNQTLLRRIVDAATAARCAPVTVVIGAERDRIAQELTETKELLVENENWKRGIGSSIREGLRATVSAYPNTEAVILLACDQPLVDAETIGALKAKHIETKSRLSRPVMLKRWAFLLCLLVTISMNYLCSMTIWEQNRSS